MLKKSKKPGKAISAKAYVQNVSQDGLWILVGNQEFFLQFKEYPWFEKATIKQIYNLKFYHGKHLHWPALDVDLELDSLKYPEAYPLKYR